MTEVRRFKLFGNAELSRLKRQTENCVSDWSDEWFVENEPMQVRCFPANSSRLRKEGESAVCLQCNAGEDWVAAVVDGDAVVQLMLRFFHESKDRANVVNNDHKSFLVSHVLRQALANLAGNLLMRLVGIGHQKVDIVDHATLSEWIFDVGSGAVIVEIQVGHAFARLVVSPNLAFQACASKADEGPVLPAIDFRKALNMESFELLVMAGEAEIEIGALETLRVGDVIRLNTRVDTPFSLMDTAGNQMGHAFLGVFDGNKAVQLAK